MINLFSLPIEREELERKSQYRISRMNKLPRLVTRPSGNEGIAYFLHQLKNRCLRDFFVVLSMRAWVGERTYTHTSTHTHTHTHTSMHTVHTTAAELHYIMVSGFLLMEHETSKIT